MNNIVQQIYDAILWFINIIRDLVETLSNKKPIVPPTTAPANEETTVD